MVTMEAGQCAQFIAFLVLSQAYHTTANDLNVFVLGDDIPDKYFLNLNVKHTDYFCLMFMAPSRTRSMTG
jgi:hypothetical protein